MLHNIDIGIVRNFQGSIEQLAYYLYDKNVTENSKFGDSIWEFNTKPNIDRINFLEREKKLNNKSLIIFWKLLIFLVILKKNKKNKAQAVFVSYTSPLIRYLNTINFPSFTLFTSQNALEYIDLLQMQKGTPRYKSHQLSVLKDWFLINQDLPIFFRLPGNPLANIDTNGLFKEKNINFKKGGKNKIDNGQDDGWTPLTIPQAMFLTREAITWVENYSDDILDIYDIWKDYAGKYAKYNNFEAFGDYHINRNSINSSKNKKLADIVYSHFSEEPDKLHPFYNIWHSGFEFANNNLSGKRLKLAISQKDVMNHVRSLYGACIVLILISTGMRRSELFSLQRGCIDTSTNPELPLIESEVTKTNTGFTKLPISHIGVKAVGALERLGKILTDKENGPLLIPVERNKKDADLNKIGHYGGHIFKMLTEFCNTINYGTPPNPHSFRHTLAACVWERTDQAPVLLKMLYNHSSLSMTLHYLRSNPLIQQAKKELFEKKYLPLVREVIHSAQDEELAGNASPRVYSLIKFVQNDLQFQGKTEKELETAMEELFMTLIEQDQIRLFLTPFCVCMRSNTSATKSPCMHLEDHGDTLYAKLPRTDRCVGSNCQDSLFTSLQQESVHECMTFYADSIEHLPDDVKENIYFAKIVENESTKYEKIDRQLSKTKGSNA